MNNYLEQNKGKGKGEDHNSRYPFLENINIAQEKSWIVIHNGKEIFELIESSNESTSILTASQPPVVPSVSATSTSTSKTNTIIIEDNNKNIIIIDDDDDDNDDISISASASKKQKIN